MDMEGDTTDKSLQCGTRQENMVCLLACFVCWLVNWLVGSLFLCSFVGGGGGVLFVCMYVTVFIQRPSPLPLREKYNTNFMLYDNVITYKKN